MSFDVYLPFVAAFAFGTAGVRLAQRLPPAQATWLLSLGTVVTSACSLCSLTLLTWALLARVNAVASLGDWSAAVFRRHDPVSVAVSIPAVVLLVIGCLRVGRTFIRHVRELVRAHRTCRQLPASIGELVVVADDTVAAWALPGRPGRIVISQLTLSTLSPAQRSAVLAHERSHLRHRHHLHQVAVALAAAANPLLRAAPRAIAYSVERWADDDAARLARTPETVVTALCKVSDQRPLRQFDEAPALAMGRSSDVGRRIAALRQPVRPKGWAVTALASVALVGLVLSSAEATADAAQLWQRADTVTSTATTSTAAHPHGHSAH